MAHWLTAHESCLSFLPSHWPSATEGHTNMLDAGISFANANCNLSNGRTLLRDYATASRSA